MWTLAIGLDKVQQAICANDTLGCNVSDLISLENYQYYNDQIECMLNKTLGETEFNGVSVSLSNFAEHYVCSLTFSGSSKI